MIEKVIAQFDIEKEIPIKFKNLEKEGLFWISGYVAFTCRNVQNLGKTNDSDCDPNNISTYADLMDQGGMTHPNKTFLKDMKRFYQIFCGVHPKNDLSREPGIITGFAKLLESKFPNYDFKGA